jgi:hypothetical protein
MIQHDPKSNPNNTEAVAGAPHVHFHHRTSDMSAAPRAGKEGRPCCVELVCHGCHRSAVVLFRVDLSKDPPETVRGEEVEKARDEFCQAHARCRGEPGVDYRLVCDVRRAGDPKVLDFAGARG